MLLESDFVGTFYYFSPLLTGPYHRHWLFRRHERGNEQTCNMAQLGDCIARLHHITGVVRMARTSWMSAKTKRIGVRR